MRRETQFTRRLLILVFLGLALRALVPPGYMPAPIGGGLLFELCGNGLPAGFAAGVDSAQHDHDHGATDTRTGPTVECSFAHLLPSAMVSPEPVLPATNDLLADSPVPEPTIAVARTRLRLAPPVRAPPVAI